MSWAGRRRGTFGVEPGTRPTPIRTVPTMPVSRLTKALPMKVARHTLGLFGRALRPLALHRDAAEETPVVDLVGPADDHRVSPKDGDDSVTRELLLATAADEPAAQRASRQARTYLERRRRRLNEQLHAEG